MTVLASVVGVLVFVFGLGLSIALHELGHLLPAKRFNVRVPQYMVGFGPTLWSRRRGDTEYGIKAIPLGGYVRMIGMYPPRPGDAPGTTRTTTTGRFSQLAEEARKAEAEDLLPGDEDRLFYRLPVRKKLLIMLGGLTMNLILASLMFGAVLTLHGVPTERPGAAVAAVSECVVPASQASTTTTCTPDQPKTPAYQAGLRPGDVIVSIDGTPVLTSADVSSLIRPRVGETTTIVVARGDRRLTLTATPIRNTLPAYRSDGSPILDSSGKPTYVQTGFLGISSSANVVVERQSVTAVPGFVGQQIVATGRALGGLPTAVVSTAKSSFTGAQRPADSPMSLVGVGRIAGDAMSGRLDNLIGVGFSDKVFFFVSLIGSLNLMLLVFNLIPLLPFDGGQAAGALWEGTKRAWARLRGLPDPGFVDVAKALPVTYAVSILLIVVTVVFSYADIVNQVHITG